MEWMIYISTEISIAIVSIVYSEVIIHGFCVGCTLLDANCNPYTVSKIVSYLSVTDKKNAANNMNKPQNIDVTRRHYFTFLSNALHLSIIFHSNKL